MNIQDIRDQLTTNKEDMEEVRRLQTVGGFRFLSKEAVTLLTYTLEDIHDRLETLEAKVYNLED